MTREWLDEFGFLSPSLKRKQTDVEVKLALQ
jgi:hypothetical protein